MYLKPRVMQYRLFELWDQLVESGIYMHKQRRTVAAYKAARSHLFDIVAKRRATTRPARIDTDESRLQMLLACVLTCGHGLAALAFAAELVWVRREKWSRVVRNGRLWQRWQRLQMRNTF